MTSRNLFFSAMKEDAKGKLAVLLLNCFVMLICFPINIGMRLEQIEQSIKLGYITKQEAMGQLFYQVSRENSFICFIVFCFAVMMAFAQFAYLYQKSQVDFYHSLPIKRGTYFFSRFLTGILLFFVPFLLFTLAGVGIISASGFGNIELIKTAILGIVAHMLGFMLCYSVAILAVCITGNLFTGLAGTIVFHGYGTALGYILEAMMVRYSDTYMPTGNSFAGMAEYLTPIWVYSKFAAKTDYVKWMAYACTLIIVITLFAFLTFSKRKSESAGKSLAFSQSKAVIKVCVMVLLVCNGTMLFWSYEVGVIWEIIGFVLCIVIFHMLIQVVYELDIKAVVKGIPSLVVAILLSLGVFGGFYIGGKAYDKGTFDWKKIESVAINAEEAYGNYTNMNVYNPETERYEGRQDLVYRCMKFTDLELVEEFINTCYEDEGKEQEVTIQFTLKNGSKMYRKYDASHEILSEYMPKFMENKEFREGVNQVFCIKPSWVDGVCYYVDMEGGYSSKETLPLKQEEVQNLIHTYKEEYLNASLSQINEEAPVYELELMNREDDDDTIATMYVYPSFEKTMEILQNAGLPKDPYENYEITSIEIKKYNYQCDEDGDIIGDTGYKNIVYKEKEKVAELKEILAFNNLGYYTNFDGDYAMREGYHITVDMKTMTGMNIENSAVFIDEMPDWLKEDIEKAEVIVE